MIKRTTLLPIGFTLPELGEDQMNESSEVIKSGWNITGPNAHLFEKESARRLFSRNVAKDSERCQAARPPTSTRFASILDALHLQRYGLVDIRISRVGDGWSRDAECE
jgi:hypothetical protein